MHLRIKGLQRRVFSLLTRSLPPSTSLPMNSAPSHGLPSRPLKVAVRVTVAWVGAAVSSSTGKPPVRDGFAPVIAGRKNRRSCRVFHPLEVRPHGV
jgi:hypothetical protein